MSAHTQGPWWVDAQRFADVETFTVRAGDKGREVASGQCIQPRRKADARLIAAAPDMLSVLKALHAELSDRYDGAPDSGLDWMVRHLDALEKAIAKAEGR